MIENMRSVCVNNIELNIYQIMLLKNAEHRITTPYDRFSVSMVSSLEDLKQKGFVELKTKFLYNITKDGKEWLKQYVSTQ